LADYLGDDCLLCNVTRDRINDFKRELLKSSDNGAHWLLKKLQPVFRTAHYEGFTSHYPFLGFKYPRKERNGDQLVLTPEEMRKVGGLFTVGQPRLAWHIARLTGIRGNDLMAIKRGDFDFKRMLICYQNHNLRRFEWIIIHPRLLDYLALPAEVGRIFSYTNEQSLSAIFRRNIRKFKGDDCVGMRLGTHTPRHSLAYYLRHVAQWPKEDIRIFLGHHDLESIETIRDRVSALPFR
jgi:integrase